MPLASNPQIQQETMKKLNLDGRTEEQKFLDEIKQEEEKKEDINICFNDGSNGMPVVNMVISGKANLAPKQKMDKPERSIQLMQQKGIAG